MSFKEIKEIDNNFKSSVIILNFNAKEQKLIKQILMINGIKSSIYIDNKNNLNTIIDILNNNIVESDKSSLRDKAIIFSGIPNNKVNAVLEGMKKLKLNNILKAVVTETSINWTIEELIKNLKEEKEGLSEGKYKIHK